MFVAALDDVDDQINLPASNTSPRGHPCSLGMPPMQRKNCLQSRGWGCLVNAPAAVSVGHTNSSVSSIGMELKLHSGTSLIQRQVWPTCQPIRVQYYNVSTNQRSVLFCVNQSEVRLTHLVIGQSWRTLISVGLALLTLPEHSTVLWISKGSPQSWTVWSGDGWLQLSSLSTLHQVELSTLLQSEGWVSVQESQSISTQLQIWSSLLTVPVLVTTKIIQQLFQIYTSVALHHSSVLD